MQNVSLGEPFHRNHSRKQDVELGVLTGSTVFHEMFLQRVLVYSSLQLIDCKSNCEVTQVLSKQLRLL